ncbi:MAG: ABC transporter permease, partial [Bacteroidales bacterium]|nr:ABC transporter permease [Bacteroidales bacterium]
MNKLHYSSNLLKKLSFLQNRFSLINILGFSIGLAASLLILIYVHFETSFDAHNPNTKNIYRVVEKRYQDGSVTTQCPLPLSVIINRDYAEVK